MSKVKLSISNNRNLQSANYGYSEGTVHPDRIITEFHDLLYIVEGEWEVYEEDQCFELTAGDMLFLYAGRHHYGRKPCSNGCKWIYIHMYIQENESFFIDDSGIDNDLLKNDEIILPSFIRTENRSPIESLLKSIVHCYWSTFKYNRQKARVFLQELLIEISRNHSIQNNVDNYLSPVEQSIHLIESFPDRFFSIDELCNHVNTSRRVLTREFNKLTRTSIRQFQLERKIDMACSQIRLNPNVMVKELAYMLGFYDEFHFSRTFKKITGMSPTQYSRKI